MNMNTTVGRDVLPSVADFEKHFNGGSKGDMNMTGGFLGIHPGATILNTFDFMANILGMKTPLTKEDQAELNILIEQKKKLHNLLQIKHLVEIVQNVLLKCK
jgi:hypothetical protein